MLQPQLSKFKLTLRLLEAKIIRDYSKLFLKMSTYIAVKVEKKKDSKKDNNKKDSKDTKPPVLE